MANFKFHKVQWRLVKLSREQRTEYVGGILLEIN